MLSAIPLDTFHIKNQVSNMLQTSTALHNSLWDLPGLIGHH